MDTRVPMDEQGRKLVMTDKQWDSAIAMAVTGTILVMGLVGIGLYKIGYSDGHEDGTMQAISNLWNDVDIGVE
jgi:hypothetical protein